MGTVHTNYFVSNEYWFKDKPRLDQALDIVTLPTRTILAGQIVDLRSKTIVAFPGTVEFLKDLDPGLAAILPRVFQVIACIFSAYFYRFTAVASGMLLLKYFAESSQVTHRIEEIITEINSGGPLKEKRSFTLDTTGLPMPAHLHTHKKAVYEKLQKGRGSFEDREIRLDIYPFDRATIKGEIVFPKQQIGLVKKNGFFLYLPSSDHVQHWTANFSSPELFAHGSEGKLTQDELQLMEHPGLYHVKSKIEKDKPEMRELQDDQIALISGINRHGIFMAGRCYGRHFESSSIKHVQELAIPISPVQSRLFCMAAPEIPSSEYGNAYQKKDLEALFYRSYHAFMRIKAHANPQRVKIHTGNWGCGSSGHSPRSVALMQIAAANLAGIDVMYYYPLDSECEWETAIQFYAGLCEKHPNWSVDEFLSDMADRAENLGLRYQSNRD